MRLDVKVVPGARRSEIVGRHGDGIKVRIAAPPEDGKANRELLELLSTALEVKPSALRIVRGQTSPHKVVEIDGMDPNEIWTRLSSE